MGGKPTADDPEPIKIMLTKTRTISHKKPICSLLTGVTPTPHPPIPKTPSAKTLTPKHLNLSLSPQPAVS